MIVTYSIVLTRFWHTFMIIQVSTQKYSQIYSINKSIKYSLSAHYCIHINNFLERRFNTESYLLGGKSLCTNFLLKEDHESHIKKTRWWRNACFVEYCERIQFLFDRFVGQFSALLCYLRCTLFGYIFPFQVVS